ncbi:hypothetical protein, partial [Treponema sp. R6D11]
GNARGGAVGDSLSRIYKSAGDEVVKEFYLNDAGNQIEKLKSSLYARFMQIENPEFPFPEDGYQGDDVLEIVQKYIAQHGKPNGEEAEVKKVLADFALENNVSQMKKILENYNINYDVWFKESDLYSDESVDRIIDELSKKG